MTKLMQHLRRFLGVTLLLAGAATASHAATIEFLFNGNGSATATPCGPDCLDVTATGVADDFDGLSSPIPTSWDFLSGFTLTLTSASEGTLLGTFVYADTGPDANSFLGTLSGAFEVLSATRAKASIDYLVTDGTGLFTGASGAGFSTVYLNLATLAYVESGSFEVTPIPEPSTVALFGVGLLCVAALRRRRGA